MHDMRQGLECQQISREWALYLPAVRDEGEAVKMVLMSAAMGASGALAVMAVLTQGAWNVALYWVIVAAYWAQRIWEEHHNG